MSQESPRSNASGSPAFTPRAASGRRPGRAVSRVAVWALLAIAVLLGVGLVLLGVSNRRSVEQAATKAYDGRALDMSLSTAAALRLLRPRNRQQLHRDLESLVESPVESLAVVGGRGRVLASTVKGERGERLPVAAKLRALRRQGAVHRLQRLGDGESPRYEVWIALHHRSRFRPGRRPRWHRLRRQRWRREALRREGLQRGELRREGLRREGLGREGLGREGLGREGLRGKGSGEVGSTPANTDEIRRERGREVRRGPGPGAGRGPGRFGRRRGRGWHGRGPPPWRRAFLRVRLVVVDAPIAAAVSRAREVQAAAFVGGGLLLLLAVLAFLADRRTARVQRQLAAQQRLAEMGEMAAVLAHEIRNPLGVIKGYAQLLREGAGPQGQETLGRVVAESGRLERLVNGLLDYARPPAPRLAEVDAAPVVERACELVAEEAQARQVRLLQDLEPGAARVDPDQLQQVALNLIRNAVQASSPGDTVTVRLKLRAAELRLSVTDGGPGLPPELGEDIFKPFVTTRADGTGLGLAISRQIAEAHGGSLRALPGRDGGATFLLTVPLGHAGGKQGGA